MYGLLVLEVDDGQTVSPAVVDAIKAAMNDEFLITFDGEDDKSFEVRIDPGLGGSALSSEVGGLQVYEHGSDEAEVKYVVRVEAGPELTVYVYVNGVEESNAVINLDGPLKCDDTEWDFA